MCVLRSGKAKGLRLNTLNRICFFLNCQPGDLLGFDGHLEEDEDNEN